MGGKEKERVCSYCGSSCYRLIQSPFDDFARRCTSELTFRARLERHSADVRYNCRTASLDCCLHALGHTSACCSQSFRLFLERFTLSAYFRVLLTLIGDDRPPRYSLLLPFNRCTLLIAAVELSTSRMIAERAPQAATIFRTEMYFNEAIICMARRLTCLLFKAKLLLVAKAQITTKSSLARRYSSTPLSYTANPKFLLRLS